MAGAAALEGCPGRVREEGRNLRGVRRPAGFVYDGRGAGLNLPSPVVIPPTAAAADPEPPMGGFLREVTADAIGLGREAILIVRSLFRRPSYRKISMLSKSETVIKKSTPTYLQFFRVLFEVLLGDNFIFFRLVGRVI